jgi:hypothetical protein
MSLLFAGLIRRAAGMALTGTVGVVIVRVLDKVPLAAVAHVAGVEATKVGIKSSRAVEQGVEKTRLYAGDLLAEAREQMGEVSTPPHAADSGPAHEH